MIMKVYDAMNELTNSNATKTKMLNWMLAGKICPLTVTMELFFNGIERNELFYRLDDVSSKQCARKKECGLECYKDFLEQKLAETTNRSS